MEVGDYNGGRSAGSGSDESMSYTFEANDTAFSYNPDGSGMVRIYSPKEEAFAAPRRVIEVPTQDILEFVAELIRRKRISKLENMSWLDIIDLD